MIAVELSATRNPVKIPVAQSNPNPRAIAAVARVASVTWRVPPTKMIRLIRKIFAGLNSIPRVNSSSITPASAAKSTISWLPTSERACGPISTPESRKPTMGTKPTRADM